MSKAVEPFYQDSKLKVTNLMTQISDPVDVVKATAPKVVTNQDGTAIFLSRAATPYPKGNLNFLYKKQVCVYAFKPEALKFFQAAERGIIEKIEDIEILRFMKMESKYNILTRLLHLLQ